MRGGVEEESDQPPNTSLSPQGGAHPQSKTPPLSAAQSQMSLTTSSDLTASDPDLISSSSVSLGSSRPPSSSSGVASPDILHAIQSEETGDSNHVTPTNNEPLVGTSEPNGAENFASTPKVMIKVPTETEGGSVQGSPGSEAEEEYFEEYHLPNTHENAFVRHRSYRRKVEANPIDAPDAEKIQDLVMTGELERHGSVRRKIVPSQSLLRAPDEEDEGSFSDEDPGTSIQPLEEDEMTVGVGEYIGDKGPKSLNVHEFSREFRHIRKMMDDPEAVDVDSEEEEYVEEVPQFELRGESAFSSTPHGGYASTANYKNNKREESMSIEQSTMNKVKECMDFSKYKDIYSISGKLQDILTPVEVEEVLNNSHRYVDCIDSGVLEALFNSVSEKMSMTGQPISISFTKPEENKLETPEEPLTKEQEDLRRQIKQKLLMEELAMDSLPYIRNDSDSQPSTDTSEVVMRKKVSPQSSVDSDSSRFGTIERRKSVRISKGRSQIDLEGVFIESDFKDSNMKRIEAPSIDLMASHSQDDLDISDPKSDDQDDLDIRDPKSDDQDIAAAAEENFSTDASELDHNALENSSVNNLYLEDLAESGSSEGLQSTLQNSVDHPLGEVEEAVDAVGTIDGGRKIPTPPPFMSLPPDGTEDGEGHWRTVVIGGVWRRIDMKVIEPYKKCINSGGFLNSHSVVLVSACQLPDRNRADYSYVMDNLFVYLLSRLEQLVADDYILVYLSGGRNISSTGPSFHWLKAAYQMIDRKLKKNLQALLVVHPTLWTRTIVALTRPFISSKFYRKLSFVYSLTELAQMIPLDQLDIPDSVKEADFELMIKEKKKNGGRRRW